MLTLTPTNTLGFNVERRIPGKGWKPCTEPVATLAEAKAQRDKLGAHGEYRVYWAFVDQQGRLG